MTNPSPSIRPIVTDFLLSIADDKLLLGHRNSDWTGLAPMLEEDIAFSSLAQDEIAHAQALYELAGTLLDRSADSIAFGRAPEAYRCASIVEVSDDFDWAVAVCRQFFCDHFDLLRLQRMARSSWPELAALSARLAAEERVHVEHVESWMRRLGQGTETSRARTQDALDRLAPIAPWLAEPVAHQERLEPEGIYPPAGDMFETWRRQLAEVATGAGLTLDLNPPGAGATGGRRGHHTEHLAPLLDEMCEVFRLEPDAAW